MGGSDSTLVTTIGTIIDRTVGIDDRTGDSSGGVRDGSSSGGSDGTTGFVSQDQLPQVDELPKRALPAFTIRSCPAGSEPKLPLPFTMTVTQILHKEPVCRLCHQGFFSIANDTCQLCPEATTNFANGSATCFASPPPSPPPRPPPRPPPPPAEILIGIVLADGTLGVPSSQMSVSPGVIVTVFFSGKDAPGFGDSIVWMPLANGNCSGATTASNDFGGKISNELTVTVKLPEDVFGHCIARYQPCSAPASSTMTLDRPFQASHDQNTLA